jgi:ParB family chromosome partitioning protein
MNAITYPTPAAPVIEIVPLGDLHLSPLNPRQDADAEGVALLADSLVTCGLIQSLAGLRDAAGKVGVVAGGRRLRALVLAAERRPDLALVPVRLAPDEAAARAWATTENLAREPLSPADEICAYGQMRAAGATVAAIARIFGVKEAHVYGRLRLADLPEEVLAALRTGAISFAVAKLFTLSDDRDRIRAVLANVVGDPGRWSEHGIRQSLLPRMIGASDRRLRFVGINAYQAAGGEIVRDLFAEETYLTDGDLLDRLFAERLSAEAEALRAAEGWKWASIETATHFDYAARQSFERAYPQEPDLPEAEQAEYDALVLLREDGEGLTDAQEARLDALEAMRAPVYTAEQTAVAGIRVRVDYQGDLQVERGLIAEDDVAEAAARGVLDRLPEPARTATERGRAEASPYSGALRQDMRAVRLAAIQTALLAKPDLVLDLLAFGLSQASGLGSTVFGLRPERPANKPVADDGFTFDARLSHPPSGHDAWDKPELRMAPAAMAEAFAVFQGEGQKARNAVLTAGIARTLPYDAEGAAFFAHVETLSGARVRDVWTPTADGFFCRVSADALTDLLAELLEAGAQDRRIKAFRALRKTEKAAAMERLFLDGTYQRVMGVSPEQSRRIADWVPNDAF